MSGKKGTHDEREYSEYQGRALQAAAGEGKTFVLLDHGEEKAVKVNVTCIDLRFPVNYAVDTVGVFDPGMMVGTWDELHEHNAKEFQKLFGGVNTPDIGGLIGPAYEKLWELASHENESTSLRATALRREIEERCFAVRSLFKDKSYMRSDGDRMKMARHIDLLVNKFREATRLVGDLNTRVVNAGGCMSGKDREGVAHAEAVAAVMIERMKDKTLPLGYEFTSEERKIYDAAVTLVVDNTLLVTGYGGSKNAEEVAGRIGDHDAVKYAAGLSKFAKT